MTAGGVTGGARSSKAAALRAYQAAELRVVELEEQLVAAKDTDGGASQELKRELREARESFRLLRETAPPDQEPGDATVRPATIETSAGVHSPGNTTGQAPGGEG